MIQAAPGIRAGGLVKRVEVEGGGVDDVAVELPLEIRLNGEPVAVTMRTPGHDHELAAGFLHGEGVVRHAPRVALPADFAANTIDVIAPDAVPPPARRFYTSSSCGVCGKGALAEVEILAPRLRGGPAVERRLLAALPDRLQQPVFERTGGVHATGLFTGSGGLLLVREDVGRHNAMDKVIGHALLAGVLPLTERILCVSGRLCFELVQKAAVAGAAILVGVGAPTSLAIELAADRGMTLVGFARHGRVRVYTHMNRVV